MKKYSGAVKLWLAIGLFMIFVQVVVGGITRLTGSGLSITKWEIVTGTFPPLNATQWDEAFELYKATPQYEKINEGMSMGEFKFIYFWEYIHRLWARLMGFVFIIPLAYFLWKEKLDTPLIRRLVVVFLMAGLVASFGWIMVASGLIHRPWVNAYKLTMHLSLAFILYCYLFWTTLKVFQPQPVAVRNTLLKNGGTLLFSVTAVQVILGGLMSGMKAALSYPSWPDMNGEAIPQILFAGDNWNVENFVNYDISAFMPALVQFSHRSIAYLLVIIAIWFIYQSFKYPVTGIFRTGLFLLISMLITQVLLGILTLIYSVGTIPVGLGVMHQAGALVLLSIVIFLNYQLRAGDPVEA